MRSGRLSIVIAGILGLAFQPALAQPNSQKTEDDCRVDFLERSNPPDWVGYEECRRQAVQIRPDENIIIEQHRGIAPPTTTIRDIDRERRDGGS